MINKLKNLAFEDELGPLVLQAPTLVPSLGSFISAQAASIEKLVADLKAAKADAERIAKEMEAKRLAAEAAQRKRLEAQKKAKEEMEKKKKAAEEAARKKKLAAATDEAAQKVIPRDDLSSVAHFVHPLCGCHPWLLFVFQYDID